MSRIASAIVVVATMGALAASDADAQFPGGPGGGTRAGQGASQVGGSHPPSSRIGQDSRPGDTPVSVSGQVQLNLDRLAEDLRITAAQQKAWDDYATRVIRLADDIARARFAMRDLQSEGITAPQAFDRIAETAQNRLTAVEEIVEAGRALYARLSPEQQKLADRQLARVALSLASGAPPPTPPRPDDGSGPGAKTRSP